MTEFAIFALGGLLNFLNFHRRVSGETAESMPYKHQGYAMAFIIGFIIWGGLMNLVYWIAT